MEKVEFLNGGSSSSYCNSSVAEEQSKSLTSIEADRSFEEYCDENNRLMEVNDDCDAGEVRDDEVGSLLEPQAVGKNIAFVQPNNHRRSDEPTELSFEKFPENHEEKLKRIKIENALDDSSTTQDEWRKFAKSEYGLINGEYDSVY
ncbi:uncharacterized protein LOC134287975 [Aedes albopictus]|uniref:Uncharacterized protein n=1 Tax=Aedes albopictus TaxID=7160 RepID=A0ABM1Z1V4_AEDAL